VHRRSRSRNRAKGVALASAVVALAAVLPGQSAAGATTPVVWRTDNDRADYDTKNLDEHKAPQWFSDAKLGTFITWGAYSVPAYAPKDAAKGNVYAEWYGSEMAASGSATNAYHRDTYGTDVAYDDFLKQWKAESWNPDDWLKLFKDGGSKYYVLVAKHHDGVALWDSKVSDRDTVAYGPKRDFAKELVEANRRGGYGLKNGMYFSMPEWYGPDQPQQWGGWFGKGAPKNPYTGAPVPYTGYKPVKDWVMDYQYPQMNELVDNFDPDLFWCDIGGLNNSDQFMARYFNQAKNRYAPKDVAIDNRCGNQHADFTTPEYSVEPDIKKSAWEASRGIGLSYGYNQQENAADYLSDKALVSSFIDIVSKGGNLLLDIGPKADGTVPATQAERVRGLGDWLKVNGEAVYGSSYWTQADDKGANVPVRFTKQPKALYATATEWPGSQLKLTAPFEIGSGDEVRLLGYDKALPWHRDSAGKIVVDMPKSGQAATPSKNAWTFRIARKGYNPATADLVNVSVDAPAVKAGTTAKTSITIANRGDLDTPAGTAKVTPSWPGAKTVTVAVPALKGHERKTAVLDLVVPAGTPGGTATVKVDATVRGQHFIEPGRLPVVGESVPVDLAPVRNADVIAPTSNPNDTNFGAPGIGYPVETLPAAGDVTFNQVRYAWPAAADGTNNAVRADADRKATVPQGSYSSLDLLASASEGPANVPVTLHYADGTTGTASGAVPDWVTGPDDALIKSPYRWAWGKRQDLAVKVYGLRVPVDRTKQLTAVTLGKATGGSPQASAVVFAATLEK
jgi:alpha-L-fucosidase